MDMKEASERWKLTWEWRAEKGIDNLLDNPPTRMDDFKRLWTHHFHRRAKNNFLDSGQPGKTVWYDVVHPAAFFELSKSMSQADMERYYFYIFEFAYSHLEPAARPGAAVRDRTRERRLVPHRQPDTIAVGKGTAARARAAALG